MFKLTLSSVIEETREEIDIDFSTINNFIYRSSYITKSISNKSKDFNSFSYLVDTKLSQSDCIKLGCAFEKLSQEIITSVSGFESIKPKNKKGKSEKDHLFLNRKTGTIIYAELKANLNLDTEKSKSTCLKCLSVFNELLIQYPSYNIKWFLLGYRYLSSSDIPPKISIKYSEVLSHVIGINDYFNLLDIPFEFDHKSYKLFVNNISSRMISNNS